MGQPGTATVPLCKHPVSPESREKGFSMCHLQAWSCERLIKCSLTAIQGERPGYGLIPFSALHHRDLQLDCLTLASDRRSVPEITLSCFALR